MAWEDRDYNNESYNDGGVPKLIFPMPSWLTLSLIVSNLVLFLVDGFSHFLVSDWLAFYFPDRTVITQPWRWLTYPYIHSGALHIFFNLVAIYFFVPMVERLWGWKKTLAIYTLGAIAAAVTGVILSLLLGWRLGLGGADGALLALLGAATRIMPEAQIIALVFPVTMRTFSLLITILYLLMTVHDRSLFSASQLGGLAFGYFAVMLAGESFNLLGRESWQVPQKTPWRTKFGNANKAKKVEKLRQAEADEQQRIDAILAKVSASGMQSLSGAEKRALKQATENQRKRDLELSKLR